ncbi:MAG: hypothetical protein LR011_09610, partial [Verrucomicrobia bacterium]|nr:hypothetical protein [Verrucomicrobiota bacterium]
MMPRVCWVVAAAVAAAGFAGFVVVDSAVADFVAALVARALAHWYCGVLPEVSSADYLRVFAADFFVCLQRAVAGNSVFAVPAAFALPAVFAALLFADWRLVRFLRCFLPENFCCAPAFFDRSCREELVHNLPVASGFFHVLRVFQLILRLIHQLLLILDHLI